MPVLLEDDPFAAIADGLVGQVLAGSDGQRYPLRDRIGEGAQGWVFRATWNGSIDVVVKVLRPDAVNAESKARFRREADVLRMLSQQASANPHVVRFFDHAQATLEVPATGKTWEVPFTVLEFVDGITLERALEQALASGSGFGLDRARRVLRHVVLALRDVHAHNVVHRDLKPSNILLTSLGGREVAKVTDFGLAKLLDPGMQRTTALAGATIGYAPPEQFENGNRRVGRHTDVFSLAAIFYELVCGLPAFPFPANSHPLMVVVRILAEARPAFARVVKQLPRELADRPDVVAAVDAELSRALAPNPDERHGTVVEFYEAIERALSAVSEAPSLPLSAAPRAVVVRKTPIPVRVSPTTMHGDEIGGNDETVPAFIAPRRYLPAPVPRIEEDPTLAAPVANGGELVSARVPDPAVAVRAGAWRVLTPSATPDGMRSVAVMPSGEGAIGAGPHGLVRWQGQGWFRVDAPAGVDPGSFRAAAYLEGDAFLAGALPLIVAIDASGTVHTWRVEVPGVAFHGVWADGRGVLAAGERPTPGGVVGVIAEVLFGERSGGARVVDVPGCGPLRAVTRLGSGAIACGDAGALVFAREGAPVGLRHMCDRPLHAVLAMDDGTAVVVGGGAWVFSVQQTLETTLEAIQTTRDLFALARGPEGATWCGGAEQRVLRRAPTGWMREGAMTGAGRVRALHVGASRVRVFLDDGGVMERVTGPS
jgi:serine/threonine-protein kinase